MTHNSLKQLQANSVSPRLELFWHWPGTSRGQGLGRQRDLVEDGDVQQQLVEPTGAEPRPDMARAGYIAHLSSGAPKVSWPQLSL